MRRPQRSKSSRFSPRAGLHGFYLHKAMCSTDSFPMASKFSHIAWKNKLSSASFGHANLIHAARMAPKHAPKTSFHLSVLDPAHLATKTSLPYSYHSCEMQQAMACHLLAHHILRRKCPSTLTFLAAGFHSCQLCSSGAMSGGLSSSGGG